MPLRLAEAERSSTYDPTMADAITAQLLVLAVR